jgi:hypothetical protein
MSEQRTGRWSVLTKGTELINEPNYLSPAAKRMQHHRQRRRHDFAVCSSSYAIPKSTFWCRIGFGNLMRVTMRAPCAKTRQIRKFFFGNDRSFSNQAASLSLKARQKSGKHSVGDHRKVWSRLLTPLVSDQASFGCVQFVSSARLG